MGVVRSYACNCLLGLATPTLTLPLQGRGPGGVGSRGSIRLNNALEASRSVRQPSITAEVLSGDLRRLGVRGGDTLMIHVSLRALGRIDGGPDALLGALEAAVGDDGAGIEHGALVEFVRGEKFEFGLRGDNEDLAFAGEVVELSISQDRRWVELIGAREAFLVEDLAGGGVRATHDGKAVARPRQMAFVEDR